MGRAVTGGFYGWGMSTGDVRRTRGPNKGRAWSRTTDTDGQVSVIRLELDTSDPVQARRLERVFSDCFQLRRTLQRQARSRVDAYWADRTNRSRDPKAARERYGLTRQALTVAAKTHLDAAPHLAGGCTKAMGLHLAASVWTAVERHLFADASGRRAGRPRPGHWFGFTRIPGRAKSHTKPRKWETFRLHGTLEGHRAAYTDPHGRFWQPRRMRPVSTAGSWWDHHGPLVVVATGLSVGQLVLPVRLPAGAGQQLFLDHHLADPARWHKIDLVRHRDPNRRGGWRYEAHLMVLTVPYVAPAVASRRQAAPQDRCGGIDVNVSNVTIASHTNSQDLRISRVERDAGQRAAETARREKERNRQKALDRSRRASNPAQYRLSKRQQADANRRETAGRQPRTVVPVGPRVTRADGRPVQAYRRDHLSRSYRQQRAAAARDAAAATRARRDHARTVAGHLVSVHGTDLVVEDTNLAGWARQWGRALHAFTPGTLLTALTREIEATTRQTGTGGGLRKAATRTTALSQHCLCSYRQRKTLSQRTHHCPACGLTGDRDAVAATLAAFVDVPANDPGAATLNVAAARTALRYPDTWHTLAQTLGRQDAPSASTDTTPNRRPGGPAVDRPPALAGSARRTPARPPHQPHTSRPTAAVERTGTRTGRSPTGMAPP